MRLEIRLNILRAIFRALAFQGNIKGGGVIHLARHHIHRAQAAGEGADGDQQHNADDGHGNEIGVNFAVELA